MADLLSIAGNSVKTNQSALAIVGNNIANANTEGYVRQELDVRENLPTRAGTVFLGTGALAAGTRRAYDSLLESSLRSSLSDLRSQAPIIDYSNRVIDLLGDENATLTSALDQFFGGFRDLALDASSELRRNSVLSESQGLASRFNEIGAQLRSVDSDTFDALQFRVTEINSLAEQLSIVNKKLSRQSSLKSQPPDLLNTRDLLLQKISGLMKIKVAEIANGEVTVSLGDNSNSMLLVNKGNYTQVGLKERPGSLPVGLDLVLDPTGDAENLNAKSGGEIGGLLSFRGSTLKDALEKINQLAETVATEVNETLAKGMDLYGASGRSLFEISPEIVVDTAFVRSNLAVTANVSAIDPKNTNQLELMFDQPNERWIVKDLSSGQTYSANNKNSLNVNGLNISISGEPKDGDIVSIRAIQAQASNIRVAINDAKQLAAGELLGITLGSENTGGAKATVSTVSGSSASGGVAMQDLIVNNPDISSSKTIKASYLSPSFVVNAGTTDLNLSSLRPSGTAGEAQIFTRQGVHLFGSDTLSQSQLDAMLTAGNGFESSASYSKRYLNTSGTYLGKPWQLGAIGESLIENNESGQQTLKIEALIQGSSVPATQNQTGSTETLIAADALKLNGKSLTALTLASGDTLSADSVVSWLNTNINANSLSLTASAQTKVTIAQDQVDLSSTALSINGSAINIASPLASISEVANKINESTGTTGVRASVDALQNLVLENVSGVAGKTASSTITFGASEGLLKLTGAVTAAVKIEANRSSGDFSDKSVTLERTATSVSRDLELLGIAETLSLKGVLEEDLIVFTTGGANDELNYFAAYENSQADSLYQRQRITDFEFTSNSTYKVVDRSTNTILAERTWSFGTPINYGAISLSLEGQPSKGDVFSVDGNQSGVASNENALRIAGLDSLDIGGDGKTLKESYLSILTQAGNSSRRAAVAQEALDVVYQQSVQAKDAKAGVNLDEEAADLLRFQQAYQASAKVMQMAGQLFDSILRI